MKQNQNNATKNLIINTGGARSWLWGRDLPSQIHKATQSGWIHEWTDGVGTRRKNWAAHDQVRFNDATWQLEYLKDGQWMVWIPHTEWDSVVIDPCDGSRYAYVGNEWVRIQHRKAWLKLRSGIEQESKSGWCA